MNSNRLPNNIADLAQLYNINCKTMSKEFKRLAYANEVAPKKLGILSPKRVQLFYDKYGKPEA